MCPRAANSLGGPIAKPSHEWEQQREERRSSSWASATEKEKSEGTGRGHYRRGVLEPQPTGDSTLHGSHEESCRQGRSTAVSLSIREDVTRPLHSVCR